MFTKTKEENYFDMFITSVSYTCSAAHKLLDMMNDFTDLQKKADAIHDIEHAGDGHFRKLYQQLMKSFITPIEREDILLLAQKIDDVTDIIEDIAYRFVMLDIKKLRDDAIPFVKIIVECCDIMKPAMAEFKSFAKSKDLEDKIMKINDYEEEGDLFYKKAVQTLFMTSKDPIEIIQWREIYEKIEKCLDACEDVADTMNGIMLKNS